MESTVSANIKLTSENGADIMLTIRTGATTDEIQGVLDGLAKAMVYAKERYHLTPRVNGHAAARATPNGNGASAAPMCPTHQTPMKPSQHGGFFCPTKVADDDGTGRPVYCKQKVR